MQFVRQLAKIIINDTINNKYMNLLASIEQFFLKMKEISLALGENSCSGCLHPNPYINTEKKSELNLDNDREYLLESIFKRMFEFTFDCRGDLVECPKPLLLTHFKEIGIRIVIEYDLLDNVYFMEVMWDDVYYIDDVEINNIVLKMQLMDPEIDLISTPILDEKEIMNWRDFKVACKEDYDRFRKFFEPILATKMEKLLNKIHIDKFKQLKDLLIEYKELKSKFCTIFQQDS
ncbi:MAG: hypothetical protein K9W46_12195 [Candidatus Heimdallarchaeum endolithica]|uniref:Uncharacterized protein n=1 Tax=Candidatus Heimdallarchaeum endolithica TaxID=2876572 RepID=A0A9Y1FNH0_9ARCH|nr:MAG: hypothetical protein K9W46_12195 [Candidatus Heimdallarchaeum endolithica]